MSQFRRKITKQIEALENSNEGKQNPQTVAILKSIDSELAALKKAQTSPKATK